MNKPIASIIMIKWSLNCALRFTNFCRQSRQGNGMQSSLHRNSVVAHNLVPLKRQKKYHHVPVYSLSAGPLSPIMPLHAVTGNKADTVGLMCFWSFFFRHQVCSSTMRMRTHVQKADQMTNWSFEIMQVRKGNTRVSHVAASVFSFHWQYFVDEEPEFISCCFDTLLQL